MVVWTLATDLPFCFLIEQNLGYARQTTVSPDPHHPHVLAMLGGAMKDKAIAWSSRNTIRAESVPWENKVPQLLFRGTRYCPAVPLKVSNWLRRWRIEVKPIAVLCVYSTLKPPFSGP